MKLWTGIITHKIEESQAFYQRLFDCKVLFKSEWFILLKLGDSELGFMLPNLEEQAPIFRPAYQGQGLWITIDVDDVIAEHKRITDLQIPIEVELRQESWGDHHFSILDPNGIGIDIVQKRQSVEGQTI